MGRLFIQYCEDDHCSRYTCARCGVDVADNSAVIWSGLMGLQKPAFLLRSTTGNVVPIEAPRQERLNSGVYTLQTLGCHCCSAELGWLYVNCSGSPDHQYKTGCSLLEQSALRAAPSRQSLAAARQELRKMQRREGGQPGTDEAPNPSQPSTTLGRMARQMQGMSRVSEVGLGGWQAILPGGANEQQPNLQSRLGLTAVHGIGSSSFGGLHLLEGERMQVGGENEVNASELEVDSEVEEESLGEVRRTRQQEAAQQRTVPPASQLSRFLLPIGRPSWSGARQANLRPSVPSEEARNFSLEREGIMSAAEHLARTWMQSNPAAHDSSQPSLQRMLHAHLEALVQAPSGTSAVAVTARQAALAQMESALVAMIQEAQQAQETLDGARREGNRGPVQESPIRDLPDISFFNNASHLQGASEHLMTEGTEEYDEEDLMFGEPPQFPGEGAEEEPLLRPEGSEDTQAEEQRERDRSELWNYIARPEGNLRRVPRNSDQPEADHQDSDTDAAWVLRVPGSHNLESLRPYGGQHATFYHLDHHLAERQLVPSQASSWGTPLHLSRGLRQSGSHSARLAWPPIAASERQRDIMDGGRNGRRGVEAPGAEPIPCLPSSLLRQPMSLE